MKRFRRVGILGGMGPQATVLLQQRVLDYVQADDDISHLPLLIDMNPQVPSRLDWILHGRGEDPGLALADMAQQLEIAGADALAMPCNTAHHFSDAITSAVSIPFLNMLNMTVDKIASQCNAGDKVGILASPATKDIALFEKALDAHQLTTVWPDDLDDMLKTIKHIKAKGVDDNSLQTLQMAANDCIAQEASCLLVGCTEFSLLSHQLETSAPVVDALDLLVAGIHDFATNA